MCWSYSVLHQCRFLRHSVESDARPSVDWLKSRKQLHIFITLTLQIKKKRMQLQPERNSLTESRWMLEQLHTGVTGIIVSVCINFWSVCYFPDVKRRTNGGSINQPWTVGAGISEGGRQQPKKLICLNMLILQKQTNVQGGPKIGTIFFICLKLNFIKC